MSEIYKLVNASDPNEFMEMDTAAIKAVAEEKLKELENGKSIKAFMMHYVLLDTALEMLGYQITVKKKGNHAQA